MHRQGATRLPRCRDRGASSAGREMLAATPPRSARAPPPDHSSLSPPAEEGKLEGGRLRSPRLGLVPASCPPPYWSLGGVRLAGALLVPNSKFLKVPGKGGRALSARGTRRLAALQVSAGCTAPCGLLGAGWRWARSCTGSSAVRTPGQ